MAVKPNPYPARITAAMWRLWSEFDAHRPSTQLGGIYAAKSGYHNTRSANSAGDYSRQYAADRKGPADKAAALDLTFGEAQSGNYTEIIRYCKRLDAAARARDPRLYIGSTPILREFIGTVDGKRPYAYDLQERASDHNRDDSHMWHIHLSVTRQFVDDWNVLAGVLSVLVGGGVIQGDDDMIGLKKGDSGERVVFLQSMLHTAGYGATLGEIDGEYGAATSKALLACRKAEGSSVTDGDEVTGWAATHVHRAVARKLAGGQGARGEKGDKGDRGEPGPAAKWPAKVTITGTVSAA